MTLVGIFRRGLVGLAMLSVAGASYAQEIKREGDQQEEAKDKEGLEPLGIRAGAFLIFPRIDISEEYNSNVFATDSNRNDDYLTIAEPEVRIESDWSRHLLSLKAGGEIVRYARFTADNHEDANLSANGRLDVLEALQVSAGATFNLDHEDRGSPDEAGGKSPTESIKIGGNAGFKYRPNRFSVSLDGTVKDENYNDVITGAGGRTNNDDRDRTTYDVTAKAGYEYLPDTDAFIRAKYKLVAYQDGLDDNGQDRDSDGYEVVAGTELDFTGVTQSEVFAGYLRRNTEDPNLEDVANVTWGGRVKWKATKLTTVRASITRGVEETTTANSPGYFSTAYFIRVTHKLMRNLRIDGRFKYTDQDYEQIARDDQLLQLRAKLNYQLNRNFGVGLRYEYKNKDSTSSGSDYESNRALITLTAEW